MGDAKHHPGPQNCASTLVFHKDTPTTPNYQESVLFFLALVAMRGRNLNPARVYQTASRLLESKSILTAPPWYEIIGSVPPGEILTRTQPSQHHEVQRHSRVKKPSKLFRPQPLDYEEDQLRKEFFRDHPWELARPRIILENDGKDAQELDWSRLRQPGRPLSGENVVQRQLWLMQSKPGTTRSEAYDAARKEFYALRHEEEIERRVHREEALWTGATFGKGALEAGMAVEDIEFDKWKEFAMKEAEAARNRQDAAYASALEEEDDVLGEDADVPVDSAAVAV